MSGDVPARDHRTRSIAARCPQCEQWGETELGEAHAPLPDAIACARCGARRAVPLAGHVDAEGRLDGCAVCGYHTLCIQKDVNPRLGVVLVAVSWAVLLFSGLSLPWIVAGLVAVTALDWLLLRTLVRRLLICYRCKSQFRGFPPGPRCRPFDLATWEAHP